MTIEDILSRGLSKPCNLTLRSALSEAESIAFNGKGNKPRNRSTNTRALSTRVSKIERELTPTLKVSGKMLSQNNSATQIPIRKSLVYYRSGTNGTADVTSLDLNLPTGARILNAKVRLLNGRRLNVSFFPAVLMDNQVAATSGITRYDAKPYNAFPTITCDIPDTMAQPQPGDSTRVMSLTGSALNSGTTAEFEIVIFAAWQCNIFA